jgi:hypothetical protein
MKLDELPPSYDVAARYDILVQALEHTDFSKGRLTKLGSERESVEESILGGFLKSDEFDLGRSQTLCLE